MAAESQILTDLGRSGTASAGAAGPRHVSKNGIGPSTFATVGSLDMPGWSSRWTMPPRLGNTDPRFSPGAKEKPRSAGGPRRVSSEGYCIRRIQ